MIKPCVSKPSCIHGIIGSLWLICCIECGFSISYLSIPGIVDHDIRNISQIFTFLFNFNVHCCVVSFIYVTVCFVFNPFCKCVYCFTSPLISIPQVKYQQSHSLYLILAYFIFVTTILRLIVFKFSDFVILL